MKKITLAIVSVLITLGSCKAQQTVKLTGLKYIGFKYSQTPNQSYINKAQQFLSGKDTIILNQKIPFDKASHNIYDPGIFYSCKLLKDTVYSFELKQIMPDGISPQISYYLTNTEFNKESGTFKEVKKDTPYNYGATTGMYLDKDNHLFQVIGMKPLIGCVMQH